LRSDDLTIRIRPDLKTAARKAAEQDHRSLSSLIEKLLTEHCEKAGTLRKRRP
jgi:hypothetical protein